MTEETFLRKTEYFVAGTDLSHALSRRYETKNQYDTAQLAYNATPDFSDDIWEVYEFSEEVRASFVKPPYTKR